MKRNLKLFNSLVNKENHSVNKDECIASVSCEGNCDNVNQLERLNSLKQLGSNRSCPQTKADNKPMLKCDKCDFITQNKEYFSTHVKGHIEKKIENIFIKPCHYVNSRRGCLKGDSCNFDHSEAALAKPVVKVPKLCSNKESCVWKPRCKYIHPEDGESLPAQNVGRASVRQGFGSPNISQQPPGWNHLIPPTLPHTPPTAAPHQDQSSQVEQERRANVIGELIKLMIPNLMCLTEFPSLVRKQNLRN